jgi:integrase/recombinase XerD
MHERDAFLTHMLDQGTSRKRLRSISSMLLHVVRIMKLSKLRPIEVEEVLKGASRWVDEPIPKLRNGSPKCPELFIYVASKWFAFHGCLLNTANRVEPDDTQKDEFVHFMKNVKGMSVTTVRAHRQRIDLFLRWNRRAQRNVSDISLADVESYLSLLRARGYLPRSLASVCSALKLFFQMCQIKGWNTLKIAPAIHRPRIQRYNAYSKGPSWQDVRRLLDHDFGSSIADIRGSAIIALCAIYALRSSEVTSLKLSDLDWRNELLTVRRVKSGRVQQFPLRVEVGERIIRYLRVARPRCRCRHLFVSLRPPYRPVETGSLWAVTANRMKALGIPSLNFGPHSLRHSCATRLLHEGTSLPEIAEFLGHSDLKSVSIYVKHDIETLRRVANFSLKGVYEPF